MQLIKKCANMSITKFESLLLKSFEGDVEWFQPASVGPLGPSVAAAFCQLSLHFIWLLTMAHLSRRRVYPNDAKKGQPQTWTYHETYLANARKTILKRECKIIIRGCSTNID
jgi:hypothetical protein